MMSDGRLDVTSLISHRYQIEEAEKAYEVVGGSEPSLAILLEYPGANANNENLTQRTVKFAQATGAGTAINNIGVSFVGAGKRVACAQ